MKFIIKDKMKGRLRVHMCQNHMSYEEADILLYYLESFEPVSSAKVYDRTADAVICYTGNPDIIIDRLRRFHYEDVKVPNGYLERSGRETNAMYQEKLIDKIIFHYARKWLLPYPISAAYTGLMSVKYIWKGVKTLTKGKIEVPVLDATSIGVSVLRGDMKTAGSIMFLLGIGELLEEWTHKKSVDDLARTMSLNVGKVWLKTENDEILVDSDTIAKGDHVVVNVGTIIPFDGTVCDGEAMVNQASLTGESVSVRRTAGNVVYAGTVVEEGSLIIEVKEVSGSSRYEKIAQMIDESEKLKSCALKLAMPVSVLSAIREAGNRKITVKGGKYLEAVAEADTIVFDKTGTLTKAQPTVAGVVSFNGTSENELLRIAACLEEHFPHSIAKAVVDAAKRKNLDHEEMHSEVKYIVAHGISTTIGDSKAIIGSYHFVFEDEKCTIPEGMEEVFENLPAEYSHLYLAIDNELAAAILIEDPLREESADIVERLKSVGISKVVMMTGDCERTAKAIAEHVGVDEYYSEVLPEDKAAFVDREKAAGRKVIMIGDGINDSPALSAADAGIAISDGAEIAREVADITIDADSLDEIVTLKILANLLMKRIHRNYRFIVGFNTGLIVLGVAGVIAPTTSALLHNTSTLMIGLNSMKDMLPEL